MTKAEQKIRFEIFQKKLLREKFLRQKMIGPYILDFYCARLMLGIEIDGSSHDDKQIYDSIREEYIHKKGIIIVRYTNEEVMRDVNGVKEDLERVIYERQSTLVPR